MRKIKIGDRVERCKNSYYNEMYPGDTDEIIDITEADVVLKKYGEGHSKNSLKIINRLTWKEMFEKR